MQPVLDRLLDLLDTQISLLESLLAVLSRERAAIAGLDREAIERYSIQKQELVQELQLIESRERRAVTRQLARALGCDNKSATIAHLAARLPQGPADRLLRRREILAGLTGELTVINRINRLLYDDALSLMRTSLAELQPLVQESATYCASGLMDGGRHGGWLVRGNV